VGVNHEDALVGVAEQLLDGIHQVPGDAAARHMLLAAARSGKPCVSDWAPLPLLSQ
jgi:hypothetical protein